MSETRYPLIFLIVFLSVLSVAACRQEADRGVFLQRCRK